MNNFTTIVLHEADPTVSESISIFLAHQDCFIQYEIYIFKKILVNIKNVFGFGTNKSMIMEFLKVRLFRLCTTSLYFIF